MKKQRKYLKDLVAININKLVLETGYYELQIGASTYPSHPNAIPMGAATSPCSETTSDSPCRGSYRQDHTLVA